MISQKTGSSKSKGHRGGRRQSHTEERVHPDFSKNILGRGSLLREGKEWAPETDDDTEAPGTSELRFRGDELKEENNCLHF